MASNNKRGYELVRVQLKALLDAKRKVRKTKARRIGKQFGVF